MHWITNTIKPDHIGNGEIYHPLLNIVKYDNFIVEDADVAIFTSPHAVISGNFGAILVVGSKTFDKINSGARVFNNITELKSELLNLRNKKIIYFRGEFVTDDLLFLKQYNNFSSIIVYSANFIDNLPDNLVGLLQSNKVRTIDVMSKRSGESLINLSNKYNFKISYSMLNCISEDVASYMKPGLDN